MTNLLKIDNRLDHRSNCCLAIVETPQRSRSKFAYDPKSGLFRLTTVLPAGMAFPMSFGFVPRTKAEDGDPIDILILSDEPLPVGALVHVQLLGVIKADQTQKGETVRNDRVLGKVHASHTWADIDRFDQLGNAFCDELERFFDTYNALRGRGFKLIKVSGPGKACRLIEEAKT